MVSKAWSSPGWKRARTTLRLRQVEQSEQERLDQLVSYHLPELYRYMTAIPLGGQRAKKTAVDLKRAGVKPGYPDILVDLPRGRFHGLRLELKRTDGVPSHVKPHQRTWGDVLNAQGYLAVVGWGANHAFDQIHAYWNLGEYKAGLTVHLSPFALLGTEIAGKREREDATRGGTEEQS